MDIDAFGVVVEETKTVRECLEMLSAQCAVNYVARKLFLEPQDFEDVIKKTDQGLEYDGTLEVWLSVGDMIRKTLMDAEDYPPALAETMEVVKAATQQLEMYKLLAPLTVLDRAIDLIQDALEGGPDEVERQN